ncbi:hypothetical protein FHX42_001082 [Saccharopolyspora lacisalsi]|uniref:Uncharacterized protein n=1 Tax=Halosaccharopolyspora lacisalsi TaxID=1000566 RepID=A0A839DRQ1_9PSEU|nr:hypothetical protein [Halosaccharopolyspora lacisalsi]MBA8823753.1 hypothetical protein [Halosaccharopolyspora lacisalsi]
MDEELAGILICPCAIANRMEIDHGEALRSEELLDETRVRA